MEKSDTDLFCLKQKHAECYYEEIQMYMGLSSVFYAEFVCYTFNGLVIVVIVRVNFGKQLSKTHCKAYLILKGLWGAASTK